MQRLGGVRWLGPPSQGPKADGAGDPAAAEAEERFEALRDGIRRSLKKRRAEAGIDDDDGNLSDS